MTKPFVLGFIVGVALLIVAGVGASRLQRRDTTRIDAEEKEYQAKIVDATPVQFGALSDKQRIHSELYTHYREMRGGKTISDLVEEAKGKSKIVFTTVFVGRGPVRTKPETPEKYFGELAHSSDAVIQGRVMGRVSQITANDAFVFTDYNIAIKEVLKNNTTAPITARKMITVTRPGGKVLLNDIIVEATDRAFEPLPLNNHDVILFLQYIPATGAYKTTRATGSFELDGSILRPLTKVSLPSGVIRDKASFLQTLHSISNQ